MAQPASAAIAHGAPEWWTGPGETGVQLLAGNAFAAEFVAEKTTADLVAIRRIVFQMLGMDHLVLFIDACCNPLDQTHPNVPDGHLTTKEKRVAITKALAAKQLAFSEANVSRLLWFALECGLILESNTRHVTPFKFGKPVRTMFNQHALCVKHTQCTMNVVEMLTQLRVHEVHIDSVVAHAVLNSTTFDANPAFDKRMRFIQPTRLYTYDAGSAVWYDILDTLFAYHKNMWPQFDAISTLGRCLHAVDDVSIMDQLIAADVWDEQRRMLPYLLSKTDLSDSIIFTFCSDIDDGSDIDRIFKCARLCKDYPDWPQ
ncbi:hypothetical protein JKY72_06020, partial [Candidatus Gracilibacteria bacterium]|nr:hypothetical protein [Candidatus Gracilibacteria bacterium]